MQCSISYEMDAEYRIVNMMRTTTLGESINLEGLHDAFPKSKYLRGRPQMVLIRLSSGRNIQVFRSGTIQLLGAISNSDAQSMKCELEKRLLPILNLEKRTRLITIPNWRISNIVASIDLHQHLHLSNVTVSNSFMTFEPEIFPALLLDFLRPIHIAAFHNGKVILTGLKSESQIPATVDMLIRYLSSSMILK